MGNRTLHDEAAHWFLQLQNDSVSSQSFLEWQRWVATSPEHLQAFEKMERTALQLAQIKTRLLLPSIEEIAKDDYDGSISVTEWHKRTREFPPRFQQYALAAGIAFLAFVAGGFWLKGNYQTRHGVYEYRTSSGERREVKLPDGSRITLDADSILNVRLTPGRRALQLARGEAYFNVAKNPLRPFTVQAGGTQVRAVGTAFDVRLTSNRTIVAVTEGKVAVSSVSGTVLSSSASNKVQAQVPVQRFSTAQQVETQVSAGEAVSYISDGSFTVLPSTEVSLATTWLNGSREYLAEPLRDVLKDIARYTGQHIELADGPVGDLKFTGTLNLSNSKAWLSGLSVALPVKIIPQEDGSLLIKDTRSR